MILALAFVIAILLSPIASAAYDLDSHAAINYGAASESKLDYLRSELGFLEGLNQRIVDRRVIDWITDGGVREDDGLRFLNHFHHPLRRPWRDAGLHDLPFSGRSSIIWGQDPAQGFSWVNARRLYLDALTQTDRAERERRFGQTFRALGQVMHLVADGAVPAHVRNDAHPLGDPYEVWVEEQARPVGTETSEDAWRRFRDRFAASARRPDASALLKLQIFGQDAADAGIPIARLWDADRYDGIDGAISRSSIAGITEYANANFFSFDTVFADQLDPRHGRYSPLPASSEVEQWNDSARQRRYWRRRNRTPDEPEHLAAVSFRRRWLRSTGVPQPPRGRLDSAAHDDYARLLVPRAVGYGGAEILDYFFRGKLDVDLVPAPGEAPGGASVVRITGTNASEEKLDGVTLELHWERVGTREGCVGTGEECAGTGDRFPATALDGTSTVTADPRAAVQSGRFQVPADAERFVAVYRGRLGTEVPPSEGSAPGAVVGKVLGGVRVEELYAAEGRWWLRTPDGIYPLPMLAGWTAGTIEELRWGDADNTLVGRTAFGRRGEPNQFFAWRIKRPEGSAAVPRTSTGEVDVEVLEETGFTFGGLVTTVRLSHTVHYRRYQPAYIWTVVYEWLPNVAGLQPIREDGVELDNRLVDSGTAQLTNHDVAIRLDLDKLRDFRGSPHSWWLEQIGYRRDGRIVALVSARLTNTTLAAPVTVRRYRRPCTTWPCPIEEVPGQVPFRFPGDGSRVLMALIDVKTGEVITEGGQRTSTAPEILSLEHTTNATSIGGASTRYDPIGFIAVRHEVARDGERYVVETNFATLQEFYTYACSPPATTVELGAVDHEYGTTAAASGGSVAACKGRCIRRGSSGSSSQSASACGTAGGTTTCLPSCSHERATRTLPSSTPWKTSAGADLRRNGWPSSSPACGASHSPVFQWRRATGG